VPSTLGFALLGLVAREPATGYALAARLRDPVGYFWTARHSQIYPELARLEADGLVTGEVIDGPGPRPTRRYEITADGSHALATWLTSPLKPTPQRSEFLLRIFCFAQIGSPAARALVVAERDQHAKRLAQYEGFRAEYADEPAVTEPRFGSFAALQAGLSYERHVVAYCDWLLERLPAD